MKRVLLAALLISFFAFSFFSEEKEIELKKTMLSPSVLVEEETSSLSNLDEINSKSSDLTMHNILEVLEVRKKIILPILDNIIAHPINCDQLIDNDKAFEELTNIYNRDEPINKYLDKEYNYEELLIAITPEMERQIQNKVEGHICFGFANRSTISALAGIWDQYPCTEAAACALAKINSILAIGNISYVYVNGKNVLFFKDEWTKLSDYIIMNYPDTWEAEAIKKWKVIKNNDMYSIEAMKAWENWIDFVENNDVLNNRYYKLNNTNYDVTRSFARAHYSTLSSIYLHRCDDAIDKKIIETGRIKIPPESIEMYNKHVELRQRERTKYPKYYREMSKLPRCYEMIRDHSPEHYKGDSPEPKKK